MASFPLVPGSTIGILGGGQLGRMLALAAARLGFDVVILDSEENSPAGRVAARQIVGAYDDRWSLKRLAEACDVVTYEFENVPADTVAALIGLGVLVAPGAKALAAAEDADGRAGLERGGVHRETPLSRFATAPPKGEHLVALDPPPWGEVARRAGGGPTAAPRAASSTKRTR